MAAGTRISNRSAFTLEIPGEQTVVVSGQDGHGSKEVFRLDILEVNFGSGVKYGLTIKDLSLKKVSSYLECRGASNQLSFEIETKKPNGNVLVVKISVSLKISDENRVNFSAEYDNGIFVHRLEDFERFQKAQVRATGI